MLGLLIVAFGLGCVIGVVLSDLARWHRQRSAAQDLVRALESGRMYYGQSTPAGPEEETTHKPD